MTEIEKQYLRDKIINPLQVISLSIELNHIKNYEIDIDVIRRSIQKIESVLSDDLSSGENKSSEFIEFLEKYV